MVDSTEEKTLQASFHGLGPSDESLNESHFRSLQQTQLACRVLHVVRALQTKTQRSGNL